MGEAAGLATEKRGKKEEEKEEAAVGTRGLGALWGLQVTAPMEGMGHHPHIDTNCILGGPQTTLSFYNSREGLTAFTEGCSAGGCGLLWGKKTVQDGGEKKQGTERVQMRSFSCPRPVELMTALLCRYPCVATRVVLPTQHLSLGVLSFYWGFITRV